MSKTDKLVVTKTIGTIYDRMTGEALQALLDDAMVESLNVRVSVSTSYDYGQDSNVDYELVADRFETDEEYGRRINAEKKRLEAQKKRKEAQKAKRQSSDIQKKEADRKLYEQLKKQFESEN